MPPRKKRALEESDGNAQPSSSSSGTQGNKKRKSAASETVDLTEEHESTQATVDWKWIVVCPPHEERRKAFAKEKPEGEQAEDENEDGDEDDGENEDENESADKPPSSPREKTDADGNKLINWVKWCICRRD